MRLSAPPACNLPINDFCSVYGMMLKKRCGMPKRNALEAAHLEHKQMPSTIHLKQVAVGGSGERFGDHMVTHPLEGRKALEWAGIHENFVWMCIIRILSSDQQVRAEGLVRCSDAFYM